MRTNKDFSAPSATRLGTIVAHASQRGSQDAVTLGGVTHYVRRAAMMLLMMLLTATTA
jgi:hypothetical protein